MKILEKNRVKSYLLNYCSALIFFYFYSCNHRLEKTMTKNSNGSPGLVYIYPNKDDTLNLIYRVYYPDGKLQKEGFVKNGLNTGITTTYFHDGKIYKIDSLWADCNGRDKLCSKTVTEYNENGKLSQIFSVFNGHVGGLYSSYNASGVLIKQYNLKNDSIKDGNYSEFYDNGVLSMKATYKNDSMVGVTYYFKENGDTLKYYQNYKGEIDLPYKKWLDNGQILICKYTDSTQKRICLQWYNKNGKELKRKIVATPKSGLVIPNE